MEIKVLRLGLIRTNCYLVSTDKAAIVIDPGFISNETEDFLKENEGKERLILLTHNHFDHIGAVEEVKALTGAPIAISKEDEIGLYDDNYRLSNLVDGRYGYANKDLRADVYLNDGDVLKFGDEELKVISTPGHTPGGVSLMVGKYLFSGDTLFASSIGRTDFLGGNFDVLKESLKKLLALPDETLVYPGHGPITTIGEEKRNNPYIKF